MSEATVALVLVSHSNALAEAVAALAGQMTGGRVDIVTAAGAGDDGTLFGTDAVKIMEAIERVNRPEGVLVLLDLGSALLSADMALDLIEPEVKANVRVLPCAFVEGAVTAAASAASGAGVDEVAAEALKSLAPKEAHLGAVADTPANAAAEEAKAPDAVGEAAIPDPNGLHARPAANLTTLAGTFRATITIADKTRGTGPVSARSLVGLSSLGAVHNDVLVISARGDDAGKAVEAFVALIGSLTGGGAAADAPAPVEATHGPVPASAGVALGPAWYLSSAAPDVPTHKIPEADIAPENRYLDSAVDEVRKFLESQSGGRDVVAIQIALLNDPSLVGRAHQLIRAERFNACLAWKQAVDEAAAVYEGLTDAYLKARATDVRDVGNRVIRQLLGVESAEFPKGGKIVVVADEMNPSDAVRCNPDVVLGVVDRRGGRTSHAAILLRAAGIPMVVGADVPESGVREIGLDGSTGDVWLDPDGPTRAMILQRLAERQQRQKQLESEAAKSVETKDGEAVTLLANVSGVADAKTALKAGARGIGLLRTEILFQDRKVAPTEDEQIAVLSEIFALFSGFPVVVRTLDAGGDKPIPYMDMPKEANPFLGERGLRLSFSNRPLFETQLRAILRAGAGHNIRIMLPMVTEVEEIVKAKEILADVHAGLERQGMAHLWPVPLGIMIEVPGAAVRAAELAEHAEFFSIGTNDLTQYTLAAERGNPRLGKFADAVHPAVLQLIGAVVEAGATRRRPVSVCGEAAGDPVAAALLLGLGIKSLSMGGAALMDVRRMIVTHTLKEFAEAAEEALRQSDADSVRAAFNKAIPPGS
ncbi:MAG: phosphoenolpyruvate--protein phosphotransferase [Methylobacteriaceae bacterium]|jgi:phosphocarrier protein FPr|nr:phosphoenolpyruvate--protein phosphotransferase [Methylobacteriaceae bacterium]